MKLFEGHGHAAKSTQESTQESAYALTSSITAAAKASGASCGRLWPAPGTTRWRRRPVNLAALARPSLAGKTPSASPSSVIDVTVIGGIDASRRCRSVYL